MKLDFAIYTVHWGFWGAFGLTRVILRSRDRNDSRPVDTAPISQKEKTAPFSRALLAFPCARLWLDVFRDRLRSYPGASTQLVSRPAPCRHAGYRRRHRTGSLGARLFSLV